MVINMKTWNTNFFSRFSNRTYYNPVRIKCKHCGWGVNFYVNKKKLCPICHNYIYSDPKEEFREMIKKEIKKNEEN